MNLSGIDPTLVIVAVGMCVGWAILGGMLFGLERRRARLKKQVDKLDQEG